VDLLSLNRINVNMCKESKECFELVHIYLSHLLLTQLPLRLKQVIYWPNFVTTRRRRNIRLFQNFGLPPR